MARHNYQAVLMEIFGHEGGFANHPADPGGATNFGITQGTFNKWRRSKRKPTSSVKEITIIEASEIYKEWYWDAVKGDFLPHGIDLLIFDYAVNSGPTRAIKALQKALHIRSDGVMGPETMLNISKLEHQPERINSIIREISRDRLRFLQRLRHWKFFGRGWTNRVNEVKKDALKMAKKQFDFKFSSS